MGSMSGLVEKSYRVKITDDIERDLRFLGQSRVDALTSPFAMQLVKEKTHVKLYELCEKEFYTMKAVTSVNAPIHEVMQLLRMDSTSHLREVMGEIFGTLFLDGVVLYKTPESETRPNESLSVCWTALQASKPNLPHRDYVFLRYTDCFEKNLEHGNVYQSNGSGLYIGASIWESIELDGCEPLPPSQNVVRLRLRRSGIVVEENDGPLDISLFLSESHPGRGAVSSLTRSWMTKVVSCVAQIPNMLLTRALGSHNLLTKRDFRKDGPNCYLCVKAFTVFRRKHHCRVCGEIVCGTCSEMKRIRQCNGQTEVRLCRQCRITSTTSILSSNSGSNSISLSRPFDGCELEASNIIPLSESSKTSPLKTNGSLPGWHCMDTPLLFPTSDFTGNHSPIQENFDTLPRLSELNEFHWTDEVTRLSVEDSTRAVKKLTVHANTPFNYALDYSSRQEWPKAPIPINETTRLKKVRELYLADSGMQFQEMCEYAAAELGCQIASICFIGDKSGFLMAKVGLEKHELPRNVLMDAHVVMTTEPTVILDATEDLRFVKNPFVVDGRMRFFAGFPMITSDGHVVGSFSVADPFARELLAGDKYLFLSNLANVAIRGVEQNTLMSSAIRRQGGDMRKVKALTQAPPPPGMEMTDPELTMQELLRTAYTTQCQVRMQANSQTD